MPSPANNVSSPTLGFSCSLTFKKHHSFKAHDIMELIFTGTHCRPGQARMYSIVGEKHTKQKAPKRNTVRK